MSVKLIARTLNLLKGNQKSQEKSIYKLKFFDFLIIVVFGLTITKKTSSNQNYYIIYVLLCKIIKIIGLLFFSSFFHCLNFLNYFQINFSCIDRNIKICLHNKANFN